MINTEDLSPKITDSYAIVSNTFVRKDKGEKHDELEVEIGDITSDEFKPHLKIKRWGDECNFSCELLDDGRDTPSVKTKGNKIESAKGKTEAHFYGINKTDEKPEGYEFEVILKKKPTTNIVSMIVATKGLAFYYQPALTQEEIDDGCIRPENVVGSYAVYHESKVGDYSKAGLKNYKAGKAFHIYRPKIIDAEGKEVWGKLDITDDLLTVEISQDFLDTAVYPVIVDPTFGYESLGGSEYGYGINRLYGSTYTSPANVGEITDLHLGGRSPGGYDSKGLIVLESTLNIVSNGITNIDAFPSTKGWLQMLFSSNPTLSASTDYLLAMIPEVNLIYFAYDSGPLDTAWYDSSNSYSSPTHPTDAAHLTSGYSSRKYSAYCTYTATEGAAVPVFIHHMRQQGIL